ncbi:hypothetical protein F5Y00DRAFT_193749 [Daldinia vernicosa]|uniref:uncharacterized protein n=1 Tax=Daldinia vernicosa TaxID=114800 RepID=UPI002007E49F|nr:uncharacterized protein F5Y00DRAFT_193749 [Daldinia vernicosa]KAI0852357.1 hypothetical protein F5Y00DRAFT_193749 [Daldinia vernicosa]
MGDTLCTGPPCLPKLAPGSLCPFPSSTVHFFSYWLLDRSLFFSFRFAARFLLYYFFPYLLFVLATGRAFFLFFLSCFRFVLATDFLACGFGWLFGGLVYREQ